MKQLIIIGMGGHGKVIEEIAHLNHYTKIGFLDDAENTLTLGKTSDFIKYIDNSDFIVGIGNSLVRQRIQVMLQESNANIVTLFHPNSIISPNVNIGKGTIVMAGAIINTNTQIGDGVILNTNCSVDHDCTIESFSHISVGARICGTVQIGSRTWVGAWATIINNKTVCSDCMIGAGATVVKNIECPGTYTGIPAQKR